MEGNKDKTSTNETRTGASSRASSRASSGDELAPFSERLKSLIGKQKVREVARDIGINEASLRGYVSGKTQPLLKAVIDIARWADVTVDWLATGDGPMRPTEGGQEKMADQPQTLVPQGVAVDMEMDSGGENGAVAALLDNRELVAILQLVAALSPDERREIYQVAAEKKRLTDLEDQVADLRSRLKSDAQ